MDLSIQQATMRALFFSILLCGCSRGPTWDVEAYRRAISSGRAQLTSAAEMEKQFENTEHLIIMYGRFNSLEHEWQTVSFFGGRYELTMSTKITLNSEGDTVALIDKKTTFMFNVCKEITTKGGASYDVSRALTFDSAKWEEFRQSGYDINILDPRFDKSELPGFEEYAEEWQRNRRVWR